LLSTALGGNRTVARPIPYGKSQEEAPPQDEQTQAQEALEVEPPQEAHVAEVASTRRQLRRVFYFEIRVNTYERGSNAAFDL
jgi:hypothetical protein